MLSGQRESYYGADLYQPRIARALCRSTCSPLTIYLLKSLGGLENTIDVILNLSYRFKCMTSRLRVKYAFSHQSLLGHSRPRDLRPYSEGHLARLIGVSTGKAIMRAMQTPPLLNVLQIRVCAVRCKEPVSHLHAALLT